MKIISWNCNMAFRKKFEKILQQDPDIIVIQECEHQEKLAQALQHTDYKQILWFGDNPNKGLAVITFNNYKIQLHPHYNSNYKYIIPLFCVIAEQHINLFAIWAMPHQTVRSKSYVGQVWDAIHYYEKALDNNSILIGDFNSHVRWDEERTPGNHSGVVSYLNNKNIVSCYHTFHNINQGEESDPTWYMYKHEDKPYHLDYCFASSSLLENMKIEIGAFSDWIELSDHMPLFVDLNCSSKTAIKETGYKLS